MFTGYHEVAELLAKKGANLNHQTPRGRTALHNAAEHGKVEMLKVLLMYGASPALLNADGKTPFELSKNKTIKSILRSHLKQ